MCGLTGFLEGRRWMADPGVVGRMAAALVHRGPDSQGVWIDAEAGVALGHRRLAIVDLSPGGDQPMASDDGALVLVFNGEIYNHLALRAELGRTRWRGGSDTETFLAAFGAWGVEATLERAVGMFAFALWDRRARTLTLGRDRLGEKPLYYGWQGTGADRVFLFGSELKALRAHPAFDPTVDRDALRVFMRLGYVAGERTIYRGVRRLPPGCVLRLGPGAAEATPTAYWSAREVAAAGAADRLSADRPVEAVDALERLLDDAVALQMVADVPLGAFLSGGVDSSTVVALMQRRSASPVRTFTIGFHEEAYNEAEHARRVAAHLGTEHTDLYVSPAEALAEVPRMPGIYDEPFADPSQIPTFLVSRLARTRVTVSLSGDGGDELFCGYPRYVDAPRLWRAIGAAPARTRAFVADRMRRAPPGVWDGVSLPVRLLKGERAAAALRQKLRRAADAVAAADLAALNRAVLTRWSDASDVVIGGDGGAPGPDAAAATPGLSDPERLMLADMVEYLPDDLLAKVDRAAMSVSLETRVPLLDPRVVAFAWRVPMALKRRDGRSKWILRQVLERHVPREIVDRPKMGFSVPIAAWLRGPLRGWAEALLDEDRLRREGFLRPGPVRRLWAEHLSGRWDWDLPLWNALMFQAWLEAERASAPTAAAPAMVPA
jgi:asparagine synthase (glutamine-hydrolysing)